MAGVAVPGPSVTDRRFEAITGGRAERLDRFLLRSRCGYGWDEAGGLPWWQYEAFLEMAREEAGLAVEWPAASDDGFPVEEVVVAAAQPRPSMDGPVRLVEGG